MAGMPSDSSGYVDVGDTRLWVIQRGPETGPPVLLLHGGPGLDHHVFGDYLDPLADKYRLVLVDQRSQGRSYPTPPETWTLDQLARDVDAIAAILELDRYAVLGHSYGAYVALQHAVDNPGAAAATILSSGVPSARYMAVTTESLAKFEPVELREQVQQSWAREADAQSAQDFAYLMRDQLPFHFADPQDPRVAEYGRHTARTVYSPDVLRYAARGQYGAIEVESQLSRVTQPVLVLAGRHDRAGATEAAEVMARKIAKAELVIFEQSGRMTFVEEQQPYLDAVRSFLDKTLR